MSILIHFRARFFSGEVANHSTISRKYAYANDLAIMHADGDWQTMEGVLSKDMETAGEYLQTYKLKLSTTKAMLAIFHLNHKEAKHELRVNINNKTLHFCSKPKYLRISLGRTLTYRQHLESFRKKLTSRVSLLRRLADCSLGAVATKLRKNSFALVHSIAECCAPVWCCSAHTRLIDPATNDALQTVAGCLHPTPADNLPIVTGIQPAAFRCKGATLSLTHRHMEYCIGSESKGSCRSRSKAMISTLLVSLKNLCLTSLFNRALLTVK